MISYYQRVSANKAKSGLVIGIFIAFITLTAYAICYSLGFDYSAVGIALIVSGALSFASYYYSDQMILGLSNAKPADKTNYFHFYTVSENVARSAGIPQPRLYVIDDSAMNAFATGRDPEHAIVCATTGLLEKLNRTQLEGVVAHEMSHIKNYDTRLMSIITILVGLIALMSDVLLRTRIRGRSNRDDGGLGAILLLVGFVLAILSPLIAQLMQLAISRRREFLADASAASITKYPEGLASALEKLSADKEPLEVANKATGHLFIVNPLNNRHDSIGWFAGLFNTHPPIAERIKALRS